MKASGVSMRSQRMKLPVSVGLKKTKAIECMLTELGIPAQPPCTGTNNREESFSKVVPYFTFLHIDLWNQTNRKLGYC